MRFYKYQKPGNLEFGMLRRGEIFFASHAELNDAHECRPRYVLRGSTELWSRLACHVLEHVCLCTKYGRGSTDAHIQELIGLGQPIGQLMKKKVGNRDFGIEDLSGLFTDTLRAALEDRFPQEIESQFLLQLSEAFIKQTIPELLNEPAYIASFSRNPTNPTMWAHYAGAEKGFVTAYATADDKIGVHSPIPILHGTRPIGEESLGHFELGIYNEDRLQLTAVTYATRPPKANAFHRLIPKFSYTEEEDHYDVPALLGDDAPEKQERTIGLIKYSDWRYEREVRAFLPSFGELPSDVRILRVSPEDISGLIFGPMMSRRDKVRAIVCCHLMRKSSPQGAEPPLPPFVFLQASQTLDRFGLDIHPFGVLDGMFFNRLLPLKRVNQLDKAARDDVQRICNEIAKEARGSNTIERITD